MYIIVCALLIGLFIGFPMGYLIGMKVACDELSEDKTRKNNIVKVS